MNSGSSRSFNRFYQAWVEQLHHLTPTLCALAEGDEESARMAVEKVMGHYSELYGARAAAAEGDVLGLFSAPWATSLERSLHWVAGFRPTTAFHIIYTESSSRFESHVANFLMGRRTGDLGELTAEQLTRVSELQVETVRAENQISRRVSAWQEDLVGMDWATLALCCGAGDALQGRLARLRGLLASADQLRLRTLREVVGLLSARQAAEFLLAFSQLRLGIRSWGMQHLHQPASPNPSVKSPTPTLLDH